MKQVRKEIAKAKREARERQEAEEAGSEEEKS